MKIHVVQLGDTLWKIAKKHNVDHEALKKMNKQLTSPESLKPGMKVKVPTGGIPVKKKKAAKEMPKYKKEVPKMNKKPVEKKVEKTEAKEPAPKKSIKQDLPGGQSMNEQSAGEPPRPNPTNVDSQEESMPPEGWAHHYPLHGLPDNWQSGEGPQVSGAHSNPNENPMMPPHQMSPAQYGPNANPMMQPHQ
ncbi:MAG TPA: LysM peptidoglycan-binding domain-containing protein, partial [Bacillales bacterium]